MTAFDLAAIFLGLTAVISWVNTRVLRWPSAIGIVAIGAAAALMLIGLDRVMPRSVERLAAPLRAFNFSKTVLNVMLAFLMFAGGMQIDAQALRRAIWSTLVLATLGVAVSTAVVGLGFSAVSQLTAVPISLGWALVFGAIISPTDPVAVLAVLKTTRLPADLKALMQGESLFNDGVGILLFGAALAFATAPQSAPDAGHLLAELAREGLGGAALGIAMGAMALKAMQAIDEYSVETSITVALATGVYAIAERLQVSAPIAAAAAGLMIGGPHAEHAMSETTRRYVRAFWRLVDDILNSLFFLLIGLELLELPLDPRFALMAGAAIPISLIARFLSVLGPSLALAHLREEFGTATIPLLTWGGVRGGLSIALALSLPNTPQKGLLLVSTYAVALFSIVVQGLTIRPLARSVLG